MDLSKNKEQREVSQKLQVVRGQLQHTILQGRYQIGKALDKGYFGCIYECVDLEQ